MSESRIAQYLLERLQAAGISHVFGVPGDYVLRFYEILTQSSITHIGTTREDTAAFAADGYARCHGLGAVAVTYGVGALSVVNAVAGAYAESSPVVVISGAPGVEEQRKDPLIHHRFGPFTFQREIFDRITCATAVLDDPLTALREIDRTLEAARYHSKPVYIEIPRDRVDTPGYPVPSKMLPVPSSDPDALLEAVQETLTALDRAATPVLLAGVEAHRRGLQDELAQLVLNAHLPVAATLTGKSVVGERHPAYLGIYEGAIGSELARQRVENADVLLMLGVTLNDVDLGINTARLDPNRIIRASQDEVFFRHHRYPQVYLSDFLQALNRAVQQPLGQWPAQASMPIESDFPETGKELRIGRLIHRLNAFLTPDMSVVVDTGDCLFAAVELHVHERTEFFASAYYTTMGFAVPAALGAQVARPERRPLVLVGDGAFQMTGTELSTCARLGLNPIVVVFNNRGYSTERFILDGPFNDIADWQVHRLGELFGPLHGFDAQDEATFEHALQAALNIHDAPVVINAHLRPDDPSPAMRRLAQSLREKVTNESAIKTRA